MKHFIIISILCVLTISCKKQSKTATTEPTIQEEIDQSIVDAQTEIQSVTEENEADTLLKPKDDSYQSYLSTELWEFTKGIASGGNAAEHVEGRWIKFDEAYTFSTGKWENTITVGEFSVDTSGILHLKPTDGTDRESEWKIRKKLNSMVWSGTPKFGNNTSQYFLVRSKTIPKQIY